jgi:hypothetical protein
MWGRCKRCSGSEEGCGPVYFVSGISVTFT